MGLIEEVRQILGEAPESLGPPPLLSIPDPAIEKSLGLLLAEKGPKGIPLKQTIRQAYLTKRPAWYKARTSDRYRAATERVRSLYRGIDAREGISGSAIKSVVAEFLGLIKTDRNILLNLAYLPSPDPDFLYTHSINSSLLAMALATHAGYSEEQAMEIAVAAVLLDVGMLRVPEAIRNKAGALTAEELYEIHKHPVIGADLISPIPDLAPVSVLAIYQHHERLSGAGYPRQRGAHLIHDFARILAVADTYAAMVASRSYRKPLMPYQAMESIIKMGSAGLLDAGIIRKFLETLSLFPVGSLVQLESGRTGKVIQANPADFTKPVVAVLFHGPDRPALPGTVLDLSKPGAEDRIVKALDADGILQEPMDGF